MSSTPPSPSISIPSRPISVDVDEPSPIISIPSISVDVDEPSPIISIPSISVDVDDDTDAVILDDIPNTTTTSPNSITFTNLDERAQLQPRSSSTSASSSLDNCVPLPIGLEAASLRASSTSVSSSLDNFVPLPRGLEAASLRVTDDGRGVRLESIRRDNPLLTNVDDSLPPSPCLSPPSPLSLSRTPSVTSMVKVSPLKIMVQPPVGTDEQYEHVPPPVTPRVAPRQSPLLQPPLPQPPTLPKNFIPVKHSYLVGDRVQVRDYGIGSIRYIGPRAGNYGDAGDNAIGSTLTRRATSTLMSGFYKRQSTYRLDDKMQLVIGVELDMPYGKHNGTVDGYPYFTCRSDYGILSDLKCISRTLWGDSLCAYSSARGNCRSKLDPSDKAIYCNLHLCPVCGHSKPSQDTTCDDHEEQDHYEAASVGLYEEISDPNVDAVDMRAKTNVDAVDIRAAHRNSLVELFRTSGSFELPATTPVPPPLLSPPTSPSTADHSPPPLPTPRALPPISTSVASSLAASPTHSYTLTSRPVTPDISSLPNPDEGVSKLNTIKKSMGTAGLTAAGVMQEGWTGQSGRTAVKWMFVRLPVPLISFLIGLGLIAGLSFMIAQDIPAFDISLNSFSIPTAETSMRADGEAALRTNCQSSKCARAHCPEEEESNRRYSRSLSGSHGPSLSMGTDFISELVSLATTSTSVFERTTERELNRQRRASGAFQVMVVYKAKGNMSNMLNPDNIKDMHNMESRITAFAMENSMEAEWKSILRFMYPMNGKLGENVQILSAAQVKDGMDYAFLEPEEQQSEYARPIGQGAWLLGSSDFKKYAQNAMDWPASCGEAELLYCTEYLRSQVTLSATQPTDAEIDSWVTFLNTLGTEEVEVLYASGPFFDYKILQMVYNDIHYIVYALIFIVAFMVCHTGSIFITVLGIANIVGAFPLGYSIYWHVFDRANLSVLTVVSFFVVLGIGVDDVFVFVDMFRGPGNELALTDRVVHMMNTAARATLFTSITSAAAFLANTLSSIPAINDFGLLTALVILCNYFLMLFIMPPALVFWWQYLEPLERRFWWLMKWLFCGPCKLVWYCCKRKQGQRKSSIANAQYGIELNNLSLAKGDRDGDDDAFDTSHDDESGILEYVLFVGLGSLVVKGRKVIPVLFLLLTCVAIYQASLLQPASKPPSIFSEESELGKVQALENVFASWDNGGGTLGGTGQLDGSFTGTDNSQAADAVGTAPTTSISQVSSSPTPAPTNSPATLPPSRQPTNKPSLSPTATRSPTTTLTDSPTASAPTNGPTPGPTVTVGTNSPVTSSPTRVPTTSLPSLVPTSSMPTTGTPSTVPTNSQPTDAPTSSEPTTPTPTTSPTTSTPTTTPTTSSPSTSPTSCLENPNGCSAQLDPGVFNSANAKVKFTFGLIPPYAINNGSQTTALKSFADYIPTLDPNFNRNETQYLQMFGVEMFKELQKFCLELTSNQSDLLQEGQAEKCSSGTPTWYGVQRLGCGECGSAEMVENNFDCATSGQEYYYNSSTENIMLWFTFDLTTSITKGASATVVLDFYNKLEGKLEALRSKHTRLGYVIQSNGEGYNPSNAFFEAVAIDGSIWGIITSLALCFFAVTVFKPHFTVTMVTITIIIINVAIVVAIFHLMGWTLGGVEAVSLSILVGTCVDYCIHMVEAFLDADPNRTHGISPLALNALIRAEEKPQLVRYWRVRRSLSTIGIPVSGAAVTTIAAAVFLTMCEIQMFKRFGEIIIINTVVSITLTLTLLPSILAFMGPSHFESTWFRLGLALLTLCALAGVTTLGLYMAAVSGNNVRWADGSKIF